MPTIAQKLCHEIVEPLLTPSSNEARSIPSRKSMSGGPSSIRFGRPTRSIVVEKKKVINKLEPSSKSVISTLKSKEKIVKKDFVDTAVNTLISGPLRCDNNCVTNVRKRDACKCGQKRINFKGSTKQIQTFNNSCSRCDKACARCIDTINCGTQFMDNLNSKIKTQINNRLLIKKSNEFEPKISLRNTPRTSSIGSRARTSIEFGAKRWALSKYHTRGPDF